MSNRLVSDYGVSLTAMVEFVDFCGGREALAGFSTAEVGKRFIMTTCGEFNFSYVEILRHHQNAEAGPATVIAAHTLDGNFLDLVDAIAEYCRGHAGDAPRSPRNIVKKHFFWIDVFCCNLCVKPNVADLLLSSDQAADGEEGLFMSAFRGARNALIVLTAPPSSRVQQQLEQVDYSVSTQADIGEFVYPHVLARHRLSSVCADTFSLFTLFCYAAAARDGAERSRWRGLFDVIMRREDLQKELLPAAMGGDAHWSMQQLTVVVEQMLEAGFSVGQDVDISYEDCMNIDTRHNGAQQQQPIFSIHSCDSSDDSKRPMQENLLLSLLSKVDISKSVITPAALNTQLSIIKPGESAGENTRGLKGALLDRMLAFHLAADSGKEISNGESVTEKLEGDPNVTTFSRTLRLSLIHWFIEVIEYEAKTLADTGSIFESTALHICASRIMMHEGGAFANAAIDYCYRLASELQGRIDGNGATETKHTLKPSSESSISIQILLCRLRCCIGDIKCHQFDYEGAADTYESCISIMTELQPALISAAAQSCFDSMTTSHYHECSFLLFLKLRLAVCQHKMCDFDQALQLLADVNASCEKSSITLTSALTKERTNKSLRSALAYMKKLRTRVLMQLATVQYEVSMHSSAETNLKQSLLMCEEQFGKFHPHTFCCLDKLGRLYNAQRKLKAAGDVYSKLYNRGCKVFGNLRPCMRSCTAALANVYFLQWEYAAAEPLMIKCAESLIRQHGFRHAETLDAFMNVANLYVQQERISEAAVLMDRVIKEGLRLWGSSTHPQMCIYYSRRQVLLDVADEMESERRVKNCGAARQAEPSQEPEQAQQINVNDNSAVAMVGASRCGWSIRKRGLKERTRSHSGTVSAACSVS